jgi:small multidrug resistance pump
MHTCALMISVALGAMGQLLLKMGSMEGKSSGELITLPIVAGLAVYFGSAIFYILSLRKIPLYIAFPSMSASYTVVAYISHLAWGDPFGKNQVVGLLLVTAGIACLTKA